MNASLSSSLVPSGVDLAGLGLSGRVALVTGGVRGVGAGISHVMSAAGATVITCARRPADDPDLANLEFHSADLRDPRLNLLPRPDFAGLPPTTVVLAEIDPLRSQGEALAAALQSQGVPTSVRTFSGTTHDFFGLGGSVPEAAAAEDYAAQTLKIALTRDVPPVITAPRARRGRR